MAEARLKAVIYSRVSTQEQHTANQVDVLTKWASARGYELMTVYQENETAWRDGHQRELARLFKDAQHSKFQIVLVWALDRLSRGGSLAVLEMIQRFRRTNVKVLSYQETWTEAPGELGDLLYAITGWVAQMESKRRSERTKAGLERLKKSGKTLGRPRGSLDKKRRQKRVGKIHTQYFTPENYQ